MRNHKNILLVANWPSDVGFAWWLMENFWATIASAFSSPAIQCHLTYPAIKKVAEPIESAELRLWEIDFNDRSLAGLRRIRRLIRESEIGLVYFSDYPSTSLFFLVLRSFGVRRIVVHDHTPGERSVPGRIWGTFKYLVARLPYVNADLMIAVTDYVRDRHLHVSKLPSTRCFTARNGIVPIDLDSADRSYAQRVFDIPNDRIIVVTTGRATYYKGVDFFIECANKLVNQDANTRFHFLYCGDGPHISQFREMVVNRRLESHFTFAGRRDDIREILPSCHVGFHAAKGEVGYSLSILEYMSSGLLTIVPDNPSTSQATVDSVNGLTYELGNVERACAAVEVALNDDRRQALAERAIRDVVETFNLAHTNKMLLDILRPTVRWLASQ